MQKLVQGSVGALRSEPPTHLGAGAKICIDCQGKLTEVVSLGWSLRKSRTMLSRQGRGGRIVS